ncbi:MAG: 6-phosphogluconolactonase [Oligoflexia bacterium]|nr:6-phosphogluconolactonase [Oligoflexia bacterium]
MGNRSIIKKSRQKGGMEIIMNTNTIIVAENYNNLCEKVVEKICELSRKSIQENGSFTISLSGGSTPKGVYLLMASELYRNKFNWESIHFFWDDERLVPISDANSNYRMVYDTLLAKINIPEANIHAIPVNTNDPSRAAYLYERELISFFNLLEKEFPCFDLILLGLGIDGHTASLFPQSINISKKTSQLVTSTTGGEPHLPRVTLTIPVLNNAKNLMWIVEGASKAQIVRKALKSNIEEDDKKDDKKDDKEDDKEENLLPKHVLLKNGKTFWFLDKDASQLLS